MIPTVNANTITLRRTEPARLVQVSEPLRIESVRELAMSRNNRFIPVVVRMSGGKFALYRPFEAGERSPVENVEIDRIVPVSIWNQTLGKVGSHADHVDLLIWDTKRFIRYAEAAQMLRVRKITVIRYIRSRRLTDFRCKDLKLVDRQEVETITPGEEYRKRRKSLKGR